MELWWPPHVLVDVLDSPSILALCEANFLSSEVGRHHEVFFFILK